MPPPPPPSQCTCNLRLKRPHPSFGGQTLIPACGVSCRYDGLYDHHLTCCKGDGRTRSSSWGWEEIVWGDDGRPYFVSNATGELVQARGLHYQGYKKPCMVNYMHAHVAGCSCDDCACELCAKAVENHVVTRAKKRTMMRARASLSSKSTLQLAADAAVTLRVRPYLRLSTVIGAQNLLANASAAAGCAEGVVGLTSAAETCFGGSSAVSLSCNLCDDASLSGDELIQLIRSFAHNRTAGAADGDGPSVLVFGMGHSGTSSVATLLSENGFNVRTPLAQYAEEARLVDLDDEYLDEAERVANVSLPEDAVGRPLAEVPEFEDLGARLLTSNPIADTLWADYPSPALWKDPRMIWVAATGSRTLGCLPPHKLHHSLCKPRAIRGSSLASADAAPVDAHLRGAPRPWDATAVARAPRVRGDCTVVCEPEGVPWSAARGGHGARARRSSVGGVADAAMAG